MTAKPACPKCRGWLAIERAIEETRSVCVNCGYDGGYVPQHVTAPLYRCELCGESYAHLRHLRQHETAAHRSTWKRVNNMPGIVLHPRDDLSGLG